MSNKMKKILFSVVILFSLLSFKEVYAADYGTTGDISFYGTYEYPEPDPIIPNPIPKPEPTPNQDPVPSPALVVKSPSIHRLPQTGESKRMNLGNFGMVFLALGVVVYQKNKHNKGSYKNEIN